MNSLKEWLREQYEDDDLKQITEHGCIDGFAGLTYYNETHEVYEKFNEEIWQILTDMSDGMGCKTVLELIASLNSAKNVEDQLSFEYLLVCAAIEDIARQIVDSLDSSVEED